MIERSGCYHLLSDLHTCAHQTHKLFLKLILIKSHLPPNKPFCSHCVSVCGMLCAPEIVPVCEHAEARAIVLCSLRQGLSPNQRFSFS